MRKIAVIDAETPPFKIGRTDLTPFIWGYYDGDEYHTFEDTRIGKSVIRDCTDKLLQFLRDKKVIVYAHNGGKFDYHFFLDHIDPWQNIKIINSRLASFKIGDVEFRDSYNILPVPLSAFAKDEMDYSIMESDQRYKPENYKKIKTYLKSDCFYLHKLVTQFIDEFGDNLTIAGASMKQWEKIANRKAPKSSQRYYDLFKPYYYGGRVQCFTTGYFEHDFKMADINSAYPRAMLDNHPIDTEYSHLKSPPPAYWQTYINREYLGNAFFTVAARSRGAFPWRSEQGKLYFPDDDRPRIYHVTGWEIKAAQRTGTADIINVLDIYAFNTVDNFADYINHFYEIRQKAKAKWKALEEKGDTTSQEYLRQKAWDIFAKLFMNSLYGKFGSEPRNYSEYLTMPEEFFEFLITWCADNDRDPVKVMELLGIDNESIEAAKDHDALEYQFGGTLGSVIVGARDVPDNKQRYYNVATAASITGWVRAYLWEHICRTEKPLYCDTDSIAGADFKDFKFSSELGDWEIEGEFDQGAIGGKKLYAFRYKGEDSKYKKAHKGVKLDAEQIIEVAKGNIVEFIPMAPTFSLHKPPHFVKRNVQITKTGLPKMDAKREALILAGRVLMCQNDFALRDHGEGTELPARFSVSNSEGLGDITYIRYFPNVDAARRDYQTMTRK